MKEVRTKIKDAKGRKDENTLVFVYHSGHGVQNNMTEIVLNDKDKIKYCLES